MVDRLEFELIDSELSKNLIDVFFIYKLKTGFHKGYFR